jgi:hypothetical protein
LRWGDYWFKDSLGKALTKAGHTVVGDVMDADVLVNLHGGRVSQLPEWTWNVLWIIGHPDAVTRQECDEYDAVYSESEMFADYLREAGVDAKSLPGATDFVALDMPKTHDAVFVGNWRPGRELQVPDGMMLEVWGENWTELPHDAVWRGIEYPHERLMELYASSAHVVNQTYPDMERWGFHNPRHYDIAAVRGEPHPTFDQCATEIMAGVPERRVMLDLGGAPKPRRGMTGIDLRTGPGIVVANLEHGLPWFEWSDKYDEPVLAHADVIVADNLLEHIDNLIPLLNDCHDALLPSGRMHIVVPNAVDPNDAWADPTHKRAFVPGTFDYFDAENERWKRYGKGYGIKPWRVVYCRPEGRFIRAMLRPVAVAE